VYFLYFEVVSGLKTNLVKSKNVPVSAMKDVGGLASILDCKVSSFLVGGSV
jgi:hypothetical protein